MSEKADCGVTPTFSISGSHFEKNVSSSKMAIPVFFFFGVKTDRRTGRWKNLKWKRIIRYEACLKKTVIHSGKAELGFPKEKIFLWVPTSVHDPDRFMDHFMISRFER